jgi:hypothetical protein
MAQFLNMYSVDLQKPTGPQPLRQMVCAGDNAANRIGAIVTSDGGTVSLGGSCVGKVVRADGTTVQLSGTISGNQAYVVLDQASCAIVGQIQVAVCWVSGSNVTTLVIAYGSVVSTQTGSPVQPSTPIPDLTQLLAEIENMRTATAAANAAATGALAHFAGAFNETAVYTAGQYVTYTDGKFYRLTADHAANVTWANTSKVAVTTGGELIGLKQAIATENANIMANFAGAFVQATAYPAGTYVTYTDGNLYILPNGHEANATWANTTKTQVSVGGVFSSLKSALHLQPINILEGKNWEKGTITSNGEDVSDYDRIRTVDYINIVGIHQLYFTIENGYKFGWHFYVVNKAHISSATNWVATNISLAVPGNAYYIRLNLANTAETSADIVWGTYVSAIYDSLPWVNELTETVESVERIKNLETWDIVSGMTWVLGTIADQGQIYNNTTRIRTSEYVNVSDFDAINFQIESGYKFGWHFYTSEKTWISSAPEWVTGNLKLSVPKNAGFLMINLAKSNDATANPSWGAYLSAFSTYPIIKHIDVGVGDNSYYGDKIDLAIKNTVYKYDSVLYKNFSSELATYPLHLSQSIAIFGNYIFLFIEDGRVAVVDFSTKNVVDYVTLSPEMYNHQNSAQFSDIYYSSTDEFPLIFISRCGNISESLNYDTCLIYRIARNNLDFTFTLINTIQFSTPTYGCSWCVESKTRKIGMVAYINAPFSVQTNNPAFFFVWHMPSATDILSGTTITLNKDDCISASNIDHVQFQAACAFGDLILFGVSKNGQWLYAYNITDGLITTQIPLKDNHEVEGVCIYNGKMYVSHRNWVDVSANNAFKIYELVF